MSYPIAHVTVRDMPPPRPETMTIGHIYPLFQQEPETVFRTIARDEDEKSFDDDVEVKAPRRGRRPKAVVSESVETK